MTLPISWPWVGALVAYYLAINVVTHVNKPAGAVAIALGLLIFRKPLGRLLGEGLLKPWKKLNEEANQARGARAVDHFDYRPMVVLCTAAVSLTLLEYFGDRNIYNWIAQSWLTALQGWKYYDLGGFAYWSLARVTVYIVIPFLVTLLMPGEKFRSYGLSIKGFFKHLWIYGLLFLVVLPPVIMVSFTKSFQGTYPFYDDAVRSWLDFFVWEALYGLQFFALEVFFRGFMLHPLKQSMGAYAIFCMAVPYCMLHYHKPLAEVLGAVAAGIVLGTLSLNTGSIWCGVLIHISVAVSMDSMSMFQTVGFPGNPRLVPR